MVLAQSTGVIKLATRRGPGTAAVSIGELLEFWTLVKTDPILRRHVERELRRYNATKVSPASQSRNWTTPTTRSSWS